MKIPVLSGKPLRTIGLALGLSLATAGILTPSAQASESLIPDQRLATCINHRLAVTESARTENTPISQSDLQKLTDLSCGDSAITDLSGLEQATNLTNLYLGYNKITNITPLANLTNLTFLDLDNNKITNITPLANLTNLTGLLLGYNKITNITPLANLTNLTNLYLGYNKITNITPLANLTNLTNLYLGYNKITNITPLANLTNLSSLYLDDNQIRDFRPIATNPNYRNFGLSRLEKVKVELPEYKPGMKVEVTIPPNLNGSFYTPEGKEIKLNKTYTITIDDQIDYDRISDRASDYYYMRIIPDILTFIVFSKEPGTPNNKPDGNKETTTPVTPQPDPGTGGTEPGKPGDNGTKPDPKPNPGAKPDIPDNNGNGETSKPVIPQPKPGDGSGSQPGNPDTKPMITFTDIASYPFVKEINWLADSGVTTGYPDKTFRPHDSVSRAAMAAFIYRLEGKPTYTAPTKSPFKDIKPGDDFYKEICWLASKGITTGYADGTFRPWDPIARDAMAAFLHRYDTKVAAKKLATKLAAKNFTDTGATPFAKDIAWLSSTGVTTGYQDGSFRPFENIERGAIAAFFYRMKH